MANRGLTPWRMSGAFAPSGTDPFEAFRREMDRLFDDFFAPVEGRSFAPPAAGRASWPSIDVTESDEAYTVTAEAPGMDEKDLELSPRDNVLTISGERRKERKEEDGSRTYAERFYGRFQRAIPFDVEVEADEAEATFNNGVLTVTLPKAAQARDQGRRIEIRPQT